MTFFKIMWRCYKPKRVHVADFENFKSVVFLKNKSVFFYSQCFRHDGDD